MPKGQLITNFFIDILKVILLSLTSIQYCDATHSFFQLQLKETVFIPTVLRIETILTIFFIG